MVLRGTADQTRAAAQARLQGADALWIDSIAEARRRLGQAWDAVVVDLHQGLDADVLAMSQGFVWGGGALILRMGADPPPAPGLTVEPFGPGDAGHRLWDRLQRALADQPADLAPVGPVPHDVRGTAEQERVVDRLIEVLGADRPGFVALSADRGRGKSAAVGLALRALQGRGLRIAVSAGERDAVAEVLRFAGGAPYLAPDALFDHDLDVLAIDEAAQLPVPLLRRIVARHPQARIAFATTARGYEGTGRGYVLRFLGGLDALGPVARLTLDTPIRWAPDDPLEKLIFGVLALDAEPGPASSGPVTHRRVDRDALAADDRDLREVFGLLLGAHYRTTPSDLHRMLDAPNLDLHTLQRGSAIAASVVAAEGGLSTEVCAELGRGERRIRGHALPDTLVSHAGVAWAGELTYRRSVRIAVHPDARREQLGRRLVEEVHRSYEPDAFGTIFGATPELVRFRRAVGYELVRVGTSRGTRTGEPAAVMLRPRSARARALAAHLRIELARDLALQLELLDREDALDPALVDALLADLPEAPLRTEAEARAIVDGYAHGPRPYEAAAGALTQLLDQLDLGALPAAERALVEARVRDRKAWRALAQEAGLGVPAAMRAVRRAIGRLTGQRARV